MSHKKQKISDLTIEGTSRLLLALAAFQDSLDETDEDLPLELLSALEKWTPKLRIALVSQKYRMHRILICNYMQYVSFSRVDAVVFNQLGIELKPMTLLHEKRTDIEALGLTENEGNRLSINTTRELLCLVRSHVSRAVGIYQAL